MFTIKRELETLLIIIFASFVGIFFVYQKNQNKQFFIAAPVPDYVKNTATPIPTTTPYPVIQTATEKSSDGTMLVTMEAESNRDMTKTYTFFLTSTADNVRLQFFSKTILEGNSFSLPFNTFSPKNKYLFIVEKNQDKTHYLVFNSTGKPFTDGQAYLDIAPLFEEHSPNLTLNNVTGWASETLLILQTSGPSFWFELPNHFIQLSTKF